MIKDYPAHPVLESAEHCELVAESLYELETIVPLFCLDGMDRLDVRALTEAVIGESWESES